MASSRILGFPVLVWSGRHNNTRQYTQVRAHGYGDYEGRSRRHIVDANLRLLKERVEEIRVKEQLERCLKVDYGWNYIPADDCKQQEQSDTKAFQEFSQLIAMVAATFGFTILSGSFLIFLVSIFVHLNQY